VASAASETAPSNERQASFLTGFMNTSLDVSF
jgi:hypothetical protein